MLAACGGRPDHFYHLLRDRRIIESTFEQMIGEVRLRDPAQLPPWGYLFLDIMKRFEREDDPEQVFSLGTRWGTHMPWAYQRAFDPLISHAHVRVEKRLRHLGLNVEPSASRGMVGALAGHLAASSMSLLSSPGGTVASEAEGSIFDRYMQGSRTRLEGWAEVLLRYPGFARVLSLIYTHWWESLDECLARFARDQDLLAQTFCGRATLPPLIGFTAHLGDTHTRGRSTIVLQFADGNQLIYRPRPLAIAAHFAELIATINHNELPLSLSVHRMLAAKSYTWEEYVEPAPCRSRQDLERFYVRTGMWLCLLQALGASGIDHNHIVACVDYPMLLDLETLVSPSTRPSATSTELDHMLLDQMNGSPLGVGILPRQLASEPGQRAKARGLLAQAQPYGDSAHRGEPQAGEGCLPILHGSIPHPIEYSRELLFGYRGMHDFLRRTVRGASTLHHTLAKLRNAPIRYAHRDAHAYVRLLKQSLTPDALKDGIEREIALEQLWSTQRKSGHPAALVQSEIDALRNTDIPLFMWLPRERQLIGDNGAVITDAPVIEEPARQRWKSVAERPLEDQLDTIRSALFTIHDRPIPAAPGSSLPPWPRRTRHRLDEDQWLTLAVDIGYAIVRQAVGGLKGELAWVGLTYSPWSDTWRFGRLGPDLLSGTCGLAIFFDDLARCTSDPVFARAATQLRQDCIRHIEEAITRLQTIHTGRKGPSHAHLYCGSHYGIGASVYTLLRAIRSGQEEAALPMLHRLAELLPSAISNLRTPWDVVSGRAGLALALSAGGAEPQYNSLLDTAIRILASTDHATDTPEVLYPPKAGRLTSLPYLTAGLHLTHARFHKRVSAPARNAHARPDLPLLPTHRTGDLLVGIELSALDATLLQHVEEEVDQFLAVSPCALDSSQLLDRLEVALGAYQHFRQPSHHASAVQIIDDWAARKQITGSWFPDFLAADRHNLSSTWGLPAIGHALLRLHDPDRIAPIRTVG